MGFFTKSSSKQTAKLKSLIKLAAARLAVVRRPRLGRRSIARGDVAQLLSIGHLDRTLLRAEQAIEEDDMLEALDIVELYCKILIEQSTQLEKPKECSEEIKAAAAGLMFASARCGELPELLDARAILADKFGRDFASAAKEGSHGVVDPTLVRKLSGERPSAEQTRRLAKDIAAENDILLDFPQDPRVTHQGRQSEQAKNGRADELVKQSEVKMEDYEIGRRPQRIVDDDVNQSNGRLSVQDKYLDARMAAEAAFESASFAAMAARAAVELSRTESQGKGSRGGGGYERVHPPLRSSAAADQKDAPPPPSWKQHKSPSPSPSWSERSTVTSASSEGAQKGKDIAFDQSDEEGEDEVVEDVASAPQSRRPSYRRTASTMGIGGGTASAWHGEAGTEARPFQNGGVPGNSQNARPHRRHASELPGGNAAREEALPQRGAQYRPPPPYRRDSAAYRDSNGGPARRADGGGAYESSAYVHPPYARIVSALERGNEHIARHEAVRPIGTDARVLQERVYGAAPGSGSGGPGHGPLNPERRAISVRTRR